MYAYHLARHVGRHQAEVLSGGGASLNVSAGCRQEVSQHLLSADESRQFIAVDKAAAHACGCLSRAFGEAAIGNHQAGAAAVVLFSCEHLLDGIVGDGVLIAFCLNGHRDAMILHNQVDPLISRASQQLDVQAMQSEGPSEKGLELIASQVAPAAVQQALGLVLDRLSCSTELSLQFMSPILQGLPLLPQLSRFAAQRVSVLAAAREPILPPYRSGGEAFVLGPVQQAAGEGKN
jgi:hypothetical protein